MSIQKIIYKIILQFDFAIVYFFALALEIWSIMSSTMEGLILRITLGYQYLKMMLSRSKGYSMIPVVGARARKISCSVGK